MKIKGTAFLGRKEFIIKEFGSKRWENLFKEIVDKIPFFNREVMPITLIEAEDFLKFNDIIIHRLYAGDKKTYWKFGDESAKYALQGGPLSSFLASKKMEQFIGTITHIWNAYYTEGKAEIRAIGKNVFEVEITGIKLKHLYYEFATLGFLKTGLRLAGASSVHLKCVRGFSRGDSDILYRASWEG